MIDRSALYVGEVFHKRDRPRQHVLRYRVFTLLLDLAESDRIAARIPFFSRNRFNLVSLHDRDFGDRVAPSNGTPDPLRSWLARELDGAGLDPAPARVLLSCYPRVLGYAFNPLSLFYCLDADDRVYAVVHEVSNTFGESRPYTLPASVDAGWIEQRVDKALFVSPFAPMDMHYHFRLNEPAERQVVVIRASDDNGLVITASYVGRRERLDSRTLAAQLLRMPLMTFKVMAGIHYEALKLWIKRVPLFRHVPLSDLQSREAVEIAESLVEQECRPDPRAPDAPSE